MRFIRNRSLLPVAVALIAVTTSCSAGRPAPAPAPTTPQIPRGEGDPEDLARARAIVLKITDLPEGFAQQEAGEEQLGPSDERDNLLASCLGPRLTSISRALSARVSSGQFVRGTITVVSTVAIFDRTKFAHSGMTLLRDDEAQSCLKETIDEKITRTEPPPKNLSSTIEPVALQTGAKDQVSLRLAISFVSGRDEVALSIDIAFVRAGRAITAFTFANFGTPLDPADEGSIVTHVLERMEAEPALFDR